MPGLRQALAGEAEETEVRVEGKPAFAARLVPSRRERATVLAGGVLNQSREGEERSE
ncbi:MAG TPA: hypothetical protein VFA46_05390 [Actinomycetes bacterium]|nr:hypothetical protein [Actinomycetes bacterium]